MSSDLFEVFNYFNDVVYVKYHRKSTLNNCEAFKYDVLNVDDKYHDYCSRIKGDNKPNKNKNL